jgi:hypothetical protein
MRRDRVKYASNAELTVVPKKTPSNTTRMSDGAGTEKRPVFRVRGII